jgi:hypothetical protein
MSPPMSPAALDEKRKQIEKIRREQILRRFGKL